MIQNENDLVLFLMNPSFLPSLLVPIVGFLTPLLIIVFFLKYVDRDFIS